MTGLDKIIKVIEADAKASVERILNEAKEEEDKIISLAKEEASKEISEINQKSASEVKAILSRAQSSAKLIRRQMLLDAKLTMINEIILKAKHKLTSLPDTEYFDIILQIVKKHAHKGPGLIKFSQADLDRLPEKYEESLKTTLKDIPNASLTISKESAKIDGGFILVYGDIEENCSFESLFAEAREDLQDKVNAFLFE